MSVAPEQQADLAGFEEALKTLETLAQRMEAGDQTLEQAFNDYQQGVALVQRCQKALHFAEQKVAVLSAQAEEAFEGMPHQTMTKEESDGQEE